jgi:hypothetical protein
MAIDMSTKSSATIVIIMLRIPSIQPATELKTIEITGSSAYRKTLAMKGPFQPARSS